MKYGIHRTARFKKDIKALIKRGYDLKGIQEAIALLATGETLPPSYKDHALSGNWQGYRECHIEPDWLLIYRIDNDVLILTLMRTGTHSNIFRL